MASGQDRSAAIDRQLLQLIGSSTHDPAGRAASQFEISRQAVNARLRRMVSGGLVEAHGSTRSRRYRLATREWKHLFALSAALKEDHVWMHDVRPFLKDLSDQARAICMYGFTEILNNAVDHSEGSSVLVTVQTNPLETTMLIADNGVGIFRKIREALNLDDEGYAILELAKGKLTTDPERHSGEGVFFSSRAFDHFTIIAGRLTFIHRAEKDWQIQSSDEMNGTNVRMKIANTTSRTMQALYDKYSATDGTHRFSVTHVPVRLASLGRENLISRSQAKRLVTRFERFDEVMLDFDGVMEIGQAFADEVFRVFASMHPAVKLTFFNAVPAVEGMILRALAAAAEQRDLSGAS